MAAPISTKPAEKSVWKGWCVVEKLPESHSFEEVMSEQLALELTEQLCASETNCRPDLLEASDEIPPHLLLMDEGPPGNLAIEDTSNDLILAAMLQHEFDTEHDEMLKREQDKRNGSSKVVISYSNYRAVHPLQREEVDFNEDLFDVPEEKIQKDPTPCFNKQGVCGRGKNVVTKHDPAINGKKNALKIMDTLHPNLETGNNVGIHIPNKVYNSLKVSSYSEEKRGQKQHEKNEQSTKLVAVDEKTKLTLYKLQNTGTLDLLNGIISTGKESVVLHAVGGRSKKDECRREVAIKVYKTTLGKFKNRCLYVKGDMRFIKDDFKKQNPRKIIRIWTKKEEMNLLRMRRFNIPCPEPLVSKKHILVMSFIGKDGLAAPKLNDVELTDRELKSAYDQCVEIMKKMYTECHLVHADLSQFNLLWHEGRVFVIDVAQAVDSIQSKALEFLMRDCQNVTNFFNSRGLTRIGDWQRLFCSITGLTASGEGQEFLSQIVKRCDDEATIKLDESKRDFPFDFFFDKSCQERFGAESKGQDKHSAGDEEDDSKETDADEDTESDSSCDEE